MLQRRKKYKNRTILGFKTLAVGLVNMGQVRARTICMFTAQSKERGRHSGESTRLSSMCSGFKFQSWHHTCMWDCCWFLSLLQGFFTRFSSFPHSTKTSIFNWKFQSGWKATLWAPIFSYLLFNCKLEIRESFELTLTDTRKIRDQATGIIIVVMVHRLVILHLDTVM